MTSHEEFDDEMYGTEFFKFTFDDKKSSDKRGALNKRFNEIANGFPKILGQIKDRATTGDEFFYEIGEDHFGNLVDKPSNPKIMAFINFVGLNGSLISGGKIYYDPKIYFTCWCWTTGTVIDVKKDE